MLIGEEDACGQYDECPQAGKICTEFFEGQEITRKKETVTGTEVRDGVTYEKYITEDIVIGQEEDETYLIIENIQPGKEYLLVYYAGENEIKSGLIVTQKSEDPNLHPLRYNTGCATVVAGKSVTAQHGV